MNENEIRELAYHKWLNEGCPNGKDKEHWHEAETELALEHGQKNAKKSTNASRATAAKRSIR